MPVHPTEEGNKIGVYEAIAYCLGDIVGSESQEFFVSPTAILRHSGSVGLSLCIWIGGALIAVIGALVYVELGTCIRKSGCDFAYLTHAKWHPLAVAFLWVSVSLTYPTILAIQTLTFGEYVVQGLGKVLCIEDYWMDTLKRLIGFMALGLLVFINMFSLSKFAGRFQVVVTISKLCVISIIICTGMYYILFKGGTEAFENTFKNSRTDAGSMALALYASLFAYNGWDILNFGTEEIENPRRTLPTAALCGIGIAAAVYVAMNVAYFSVMTVDEFVASDAVAVMIKGCHFHMSQVVLRHVRELLLFNLYKGDEEFNKLIRMIIALPLLPIEMVTLVWIEVLKPKLLKFETEEELKPKIKNFVTYFDLEWMSKPMQLWNFYRQSVRTNNACEGFHSFLKRRHGSLRRPGFSRLFNFLQNIEYQQSVKMIKLQEGIKLKLQSHSYKKVNERLELLWKKIREYTLGRFSYVIPFLIALLLLGNLNTTIFGCSRYLFAGAKKNVVPSMVKGVHEESMSPRAAIIVELFVAVSISFMGDLDHLIGYMSFAMWMQRACSQCALLYMRFMDWPFPKDAFRTPILLPIIFLVICICLLVVPARNDPHIAIYGGSAVGAGLLIYFTFVYPDYKPSIFRRINEASVIATQLALNVVPLVDSDEEA